MHASALALDVLELETNLLAGDSPDTERPDSHVSPYQQTRRPTSIHWDEPLDTSGEIAREAKPLLRASRTLRTRAVDRIPDLVDALHTAGMQVADAVEKARKISDSLK